MSDVIISTRDVKRCFSTSGGDFWALKGVNIEIPRGRLTILKGRSGSGKTTLLNILGALDKPTEGDVFYDGPNSVAMMNAKENVEYALRMARSRENREARAAECLKMVGLSTRAQHMPQELSGGEQQRVAIARALAHKPKVIFADEPTGELDTVTGLQVVKIFKELCSQEGVTIVMTTHDTGLMEIGDAVYELEDGEQINGSK